MPGVSIRPLILDVKTLIEDPVQNQHHIFPLTIRNLPRVSSPLSMNLKLMNTGKNYKIAEYLTKKDEQKFSVRVGLRILTRPLIHLRILFHAFYGMTPSLVAYASYRGKKKKVSAMLHNTSTAILMELTDDFDENHDPDGSNRDSIPYLINSGSLSSEFSLYDNDRVGDFGAMNGVIKKI